MIRSAFAAIAAIATISAHSQQAVPVCDGSLPPPQSVKGGFCNVGKVHGYPVVRAGPGNRYRSVGKLSSGRTVYICNETERWYGVAYPGQGRQCVGAVALGLDVRLAAGCRTGWLLKRSVDVLTG